MKRKIVLSMLAGMLLLQSIPVSAQDYGGVASQTQAASVPSQFTSAVKPTDLSRITVTLPARMDLSLNEAETQYTNQSQVSAKGDLHEDYHLEVSAPSTVTYQSTGNPDVTGAVTFGTQTWTSAQLEASKTVLDSRDISVVVNNNNLKHSNYSGILNFNIKVVNALNGYAMDDISLCTIEGDTLIIPKTIEKDGVKHKITSIADNAFLDTGTYRSTIPSTVTKVVIPDSVTSIGNGAFCGCSNLTTINIPDSVTSIGDYAFEHCSNLTSIVIPNSVISIGEQAFSYCTSLASVTIYDGVTSIEDGAFYECSNLTSITIPDSVTNIGNAAFCGCSSLTSLIISNNLANLNYNAFSGCTSLASVTIPNEVINIDSKAFDNCTSLATIDVDSGNPNYSSVDGVLYNKNKTKLVKYPSGRVSETYTIPDEVTSIGEYAFSGCTRLTSITLPDNLAGLDDHIFVGCTGLTTINIPTSVRYIGCNVFCNSINVINYLGTKSQFQQIIQYDDLSGYTIHCTDGDLTIS